MRATRNGQGAGGGGGSGSLQWVTVLLSASDLLSLVTVHKTAVAAQGPGTMLVVQHVYTFSREGSTPFVGEGAATLSLLWSNGQTASSDSMAVIFEGEAGVAQLDRWNVPDPSQPTALLENLPLLLALSAPVTDGNGAVAVTIGYLVLTKPFII